MAFDEGLAQRVREHLGEADVQVVEKKMFGGLTFMVSGHMACGCVKDDLMVRVGKERYEEALARPHAREMDFTGRALKGMVYVAPEGYEADEDLGYWVDLGVANTRALPPKKPKQNTQK